jgi:uncharacterized protein DUF4337
MERPEVPIEKVMEHVEHHAHMSEEKWISWVALSTAVLAALAAVASLLASENVNEAMISQIQSSDQWAFFQAKSIKATVLKTKFDLLKAEGKEVKKEDEEKIGEYGKEQAEIKEIAEHKQKESEEHLQKHVKLGRGVTMFQIAIAVAAISALTKRRAFWYVGLAFGAIGIFFLAHALLAAG